MRTIPAEIKTDCPELNEAWKAFVPVIIGESNILIPDTENDLNWHAFLGHSIDLAAVSPISPGSFNSQLATDGKISIGEILSRIKFLVFGRRLCNPLIYLNLFTVFFGGIQNEQVGTLYCVSDGNYRCCV